MPTNDVARVQRARRRRDGVGDSWYADQDHVTIESHRPFLSRGVPFRFRFYDFPSSAGSTAAGKKVDVLSDLDLDAHDRRRRSRRRYGLIVFPGHHEYVTERGVRRRSSSSATAAATSRSSPPTTSSGRSPGRTGVLDAGPPVARPRPAGVVADRRPVHRQRRSGEARGDLDRALTRHGPLAIRRTGHEPGVAASRTAASRSTRRSRRLAAGRSTVVAEIPNLLGRRDDGPDDLLRDRALAPRCSRPAPSRSPERCCSPMSSALMENVWRRSAPAARPLAARERAVAGPFAVGSTVGA